MRNAPLGSLPRSEFDEFVSSLTHFSLEICQIRCGITETRRLDGNAGDVAEFDSYFPAFHDRRHRASGRSVKGLEPVIQLRGALKRLYLHHLRSSAHGARINFDGTGRAGFGHIDFSGGLRWFASAEFCGLRR